jgi:hypothetical protein
VLNYSSEINNANLVAEIKNLQEQVKNLNQENIKLKSASIVTALGFKELPPKATANNPFLGSPNYHYLWITGWIFNSGGSMAANTSLVILAYDSSDNVLLNVTVPVIPYFTSTSAIMHHQPAPVGGVILSQQNMTVRMEVYHEGVFLNGTRYEAIPVYTSQSL